MATIASVAIVHVVYLNKRLTIAVGLGKVKKIARKNDFIKS